MSAPNAGRQSPDPERQTGAQQQDAPSTGQISDDVSDENQQQSHETKEEGLSSNPKGPLDDAADEKLSKTTGYDPDELTRQAEEKLNG